MTLAWIVKRRAPWATPGTRRAHAALGAALAAFAMSAISLAQNYPSKPVRVIVPTAAGGGSDVYARMIGDKLQPLLGQPFLVDNRVGANGQIATVTVARAEPDGHMILFTTSGVTVLAATERNLLADIRAELAPVTVFMGGSLIIATNTKVPARTLAEFVAYAKSNPAKINVGSSGPTDQLAGLLLRTIAGFDSVVINYKGTGEKERALISNEIQMSVIGASTVAAHKAAGNMVALAATAQRRSPLMPEVPTVEESGIRGYDVPSWFGFMAPAKTPRPIIDRLRNSIVTVIEMPDVKTRIAGFGHTPMGSTPEEMGERIRFEIDQWTRIARQAGLVSPQ